MEGMEKLLSAIEGNGDISAAAELIAINFPQFMENEVLQTFPPEVLFGVMVNDSIKFPEAEKTANFFIRLFEKGEEYVRMFFELLPLDELSLETCDKIAAKLEDLGCVIEARRMKRIKNLYEALESRHEEQKSTGQQFAATADQLAHSSQLLEKMTALLKDQSEALKEATEELGKKTQELKEKDELIERLRNRKIRR